MRIHAPKLSHNNAAQIRQLYASGQYSQYEIAEMFDVRQSMISRVVNGVRW
jgi:predicted XRE-type DNA-binding protein